MSVTSMTRPATTTRRILGPALLTAAGSIVLVVCLYALPWWPSDFTERTFLGVRASLLDDNEANDWYDSLYRSFFQVGHLVTAFAAVAAPFVVGLRNKAHWIAAVALIGAVWQIVGVKGMTLINTTAAPLLGPIVGGILILAGWVWARRSLAPQR